MLRIRMSRIFLALIMMSAAILPVFRSAPQAEAQNDSVYQLLLFVMVSGRDKSSSDDAFRFIVYGENGVFKGEQYTPPGYFGGDSGQTEPVDIRLSTPILKSELLNPRSICMKTGGTDGLLISTMFVLGFDGGRWDVYLIWNNPNHLYLDSDLNESPRNRAELDLSNHECYY